MIEWITNSFNNLINQFSTPFGTIVQIISLVGTALNIACLQFKKPIIFYLLMLTGSVCFMVHFALLGAWGGCALNFIVVLRSLTLSVSKKTKTLPILMVFCGLFLAATAVIIIFDLEALNRWYALLPGVASVIQTVGIWSKSPKKTRWFQIAGTSPEWLTYNAINGSIGGVICELFMVISGIVYLIRHRKDDEKDVLSE